MFAGKLPLFHEEMIRQAKHLASAGLRGMYLDMIGCVSDQVPCHNPLHKHPKGGGHYHYDGYRRFLRRLKKEVPSLSLSTEDCSEEYLDCFDSMIVLCGSAERCGWDTMHGEFIPMFQAIYHGCAALFGNFALPDSIPPWDPLWPEEKRWPATEEKEWEKLYPEQFFLEIARSLIRGMQPTVCNLRMEHWKNPRFRSIMDFLLKTASFYHAHRKWLYEGEMLAPGSLEVKIIQVKFLLRSLYTTPETAESHVLPRPAVLHSRWKAEDGTEALFLCNYTLRKQDYAYCGGIKGTLAPHELRCIQL